MTTGRFRPMSITTTTAVERYQPVMTDLERTTLLGFLAGYRGYTRDAYTLDLRQFTAWCWQHRPPAVRRPPGRHRVLRPRPRRPRQGPSDGRSPVVHDRRLLPLRRRGRRHRTLTRSAHPPTAHRLRVPRRASRPQRARRAPRRRRPLVAPRPRPGVAARAERAAGVRSDSAPTSTRSASNADTAP